MDPYARIAAALKTAIDTEFAAEGFTANHDKIHESLGLDRVEIGISPIRSAPQPGQRNVQETFVLVQFFDVWVKEVDPAQQVNPLRITGFADRFSRAVERAQITDTGEVWYFDVDVLDYPDDPTGNKSRFVATVRARGDGVWIRETTA